MSEDTTMETFTCPRAIEGPFTIGTDAHWREDDTCSYCGSLNPDVLLDRVQAGTVTLGPTDKNYKVYVENKGGEPFKQTYRDCPRDEPPHMPADCTHWVTREISQTKAYFQHFDAAHRSRFIDLLNSGGVAIGYPGYFYVLPFFCARVTPKKDEAAA